MVPAFSKKDESELTADIQEIFRKSRNHYGTRKIKKELADCGKQASGRRIGRIMKQEGLVSSYTTAPVSYTHLDVYKRQH